MKSQITDDCVISAIKNGKLTASNISFQKIRKLCVASISHLSREEDNLLKASLGRGKNILETTSQLDKYSYTHGLMIESQWHYVLKMLKLEPRSVHVVDYGCGQGLSTSLFLDNYGKESFDSIEKITLIEPSHIALERAKAIVRCYSDRIEMRTINKDFDRFNHEKAEGNTGGLTYHLFSNVLDIHGYDHLELLNNAISTTGENVILAVSHDRDGSPYIKACKSKIDSLKAEDKFTVKENFIDTFMCNNGKNAAITFLAHVEVRDGSI